MSDIESIKTNALKELRDGRYENAISMYEKILKLRDGKLDNYNARICTNLCLCFQKTRNYEKIGEYSTRGIECDSKWIKSHAWKLHSLLILKRKEEIIESISKIYNVFPEQKLRENRIRILQKTCFDLLQESMIEVKYFTTKKYLKQFNFQYRKVIVVDILGRGHSIGLEEMYSEFLYPRDNYNIKYEKTSVLILPGSYDAHGLDWVCHDLEFVGLDPKKTIITKTKVHCAPVAYIEGFGEDWENKFFYNMIEICLPKDNPRKKRMNINFKNLTFKYIDGKRVIITKDGKQKYPDPKRMKSIFNLTGNTINVDFENCIFRSSLADVILRKYDQQNFNHDKIEENIPLFESSIGFKNCLFYDCFFTKLWAFRNVKVHQCKFCNSSMGGLKIKLVREFDIQDVVVENTADLTSLDSYGISIESCFRGNIKNCRFTKAARVGICVLNVYRGIVSISKCLFQMGLEQNRIGIRNANNAKIKVFQNKFENCDIGIVPNISTLVLNNEFIDCCYGLYFTFSNKKIVLKDFKMEGNSFLRMKEAEIRCNKSIQKGFMDKIQGSKNNVKYSNPGDKNWNTRMRIVTYDDISDFVGHKKEKSIRKKDRKAFRKGENVYSSPQAYHGMIICRFCQKIEKEVKYKKCGGCKRVYYCSVECQRKDWKFHKKNCLKVKGMEKSDGKGNKGNK